MGDKTGQQGNKILSMAGLVWILILFVIVNEMRRMKWY